MTTRAEIEAEFQGVRDMAVLKGLARLCDSLRVTPEELSAEWDIVELRTSRALSLDASPRHRPTSKDTAQDRGFHARASSADGCRNMMGFGHSHTSMIRKNFSNTTAGSFNGYFWHTKATRMAQLMPPSNPRTLL